MTIAIESKCISGDALLYADSNIIASDGTRTQGCKIYARDLSTGSVALASATDNAIAAESLAIQILDDLASNDCTDIQAMISRIRLNLLNWSEPYQADELRTQFLMAAACSGQTYLYLLQPRNNIMPVKQKYAIGVGARVVDPLLGALFPEDCLFSPQKTLLHLAYLTKHAKEQEANVGPGGSNAIYIPSVGLARWIDPVDLHFAEENVQFIDELISYTLQLVMGFWPEEEVERVAETCRGLIVNIANTIRENVSFPSLEAEAPSDEQKGA